MRIMERFFLVGYMGSGKTTIGKLLAKELNLHFTDMDLFIENRYRKTISRLFAEKGESGFREIERTALEEVSEFENSVISTGGGLPCFYDNMELMNASGITIYLKVPEEVLAERLDAMKHNRPLIKDKNKEEIQAFIAESLEKRQSFYHQAHLTFDAEQLRTRSDVKQIVTNLILILKDRTANK